MLVVEFAGTIRVIAGTLYPARSDAVPATDEYRLRSVCSSGLWDHESSPRSEFQHQSLLLHLLHRRDRRTVIACRDLRRMQLSPERSRAANWSSIRIRRVTSPQTTITAVRSTSATMARSTSRPATTSNAAGDSQDLYQSARQDPAHQPRRHGPDRQSILRRERPQLRRHLGAGPAQSLPGLLRRANGPVADRRRRRQRLVDCDRRSEHRGKGRKLRLAECRSAEWQSRLHGSGVLLSSQWTRRVDHRRLRLSRNAVPQQLSKAATSSPTTHRIGSHLTFDANGNVTGVLTSSRPTARSTDPTATSCI